MILRLTFCFSDCSDCRWSWIWFCLGTICFISLSRLHPYKSVKSPASTWNASQHLVPQGQRPEMMMSLADFRHESLQTEWFLHVWSEISLIMVFCWHSHKFVQQGYELGCARKETPGPALSHLEGDHPMDHEYQNRKWPVANKIA